MFRVRAHQREGREACTEIRPFGRARLHASRSSDTEARFLYRDATPGRPGNRPRTGPEAYRDARVSIPAGFPST
jgi:hypothetical protein